MKISLIALASLLITPASALENLVVDSVLSYPIERSDVSAGVSASLGVGNNENLSEAMCRPSAIEDGLPDLAFFSALQSPLDNGATAPISTVATAWPPARSIETFDCTTTAAPPGVRLQALAGSNLAPVSGGSTASSAVANQPSPPPHSWPVTLAPQTSAATANTAIAGRINAVLNGFSTPAGGNDRVRPAPDVNNIRGVPVPLAGTGLPVLLLLTGTAAYLSMRNRRV
jgi:hypothetical protein